jgi:hypothetical protein
MIDNFVLALTHGLLLLIAWRLLTQPILQDEAPTPFQDDARSGGWPKLRVPKGKDRA